jgi:hypothetical protein
VTAGHGTERDMIDFPEGDRGNTTTHENMMPTDDVEFIDVEFIGHRWGAQQQGGISLAVPDQNTTGEDRSYSVSNAPMYDRGDTRQVVTYTKVARVPSTRDQPLTTEEAVNILDKQDFWMDGHRISARAVLEVVIAVHWGWGHPLADSMVTLMKDRFDWKFREEFLFRVLATCSHCIRQGDTTGPSYGLLAQPPRATYIGQVRHIDFSEHEETAEGYKYNLVCVDRF